MPARIMVTSTKIDKSALELLSEQQKTELLDRIARRGRPESVRVSQVRTRDFGGGSYEIEATYVALHERPDAVHVRVVGNADYDAEEIAKMIDLRNQRL